MKRFIFIIIQIIFINCYSQKNETKQSSSEVVKIKLEKKVHENSERFRNFELKKINDFALEKRDEMDSICRRIGDSLKILDYYYKADFDNNGLEDFLMIGDDHNCEESRTISCNFSCLVMMHFPNDSVKIYNLSRGWGCLLPKIIKKNNQVMVQVFNKKYGLLTSKSENIEQHTLIYKYDGFLDYNEKPIKHHIEKIEFSTSGCYGTCPEFLMSIDENRNSKFIAERFNFGTDEENVKKMNSYNREGTFRTILKEENYNQILQLLEYMNFEKMNNEYNDLEVDNGSSVLTITYDNGKIKRIEDFGEKGNYSLKKLYEVLYELRKNQKWTSID